MQGFLVRSADAFIRPKKPRIMGIFKALTKNYGMSLKSERIPVPARCSQSSLNLAAGLHPAATAQLIEVADTRRLP